MKYHIGDTTKLYLRHAKKYAFLGIVMLVFSSFGPVLNAMLPLYYKKFFDILATSGSEAIGALTHILLWIVLPLLLVKHIVRRIAQIANTYFDARMMGELANASFAYLHRHSFTFFNNNFVGSLVKQVNYFSRSLEAITDRLTWFFIPMVVETSVMIGVLFFRDSRLGFLVLGWLVLFLSVNLWLTRYKMRYDVERSAAETSATGFLADTITNQSNVKLFVGYGRECSGFRDAIQRVTDLRLISWNIETLIDFVQGFLAMALEMGIMLLGIRLWRQGILSPGDFVLLQAYFLRLFDKVWEFGKQIRGFYENFADAEDMTTILLTPHEIADAPGAKTLAVKQGQIDFTDVTFCYRETREVLSNLNLHIAPKEKVAFVGPSGAGKSTIVKLLLRQHEVSDGHITIDGQSIAGVTQESLWKNISVVPQDPILFHRTLIENIRYGKPDATDEEIVAASKLARCHEFISGFPEGYNTYVGERGVKLSGGERQRVAIARAILQNAPVLVLDEATSSLDSESEKYIQEALAELMKEKTVIVIAHRLSTIMKMDRTIVIHLGKIVEEGKHVDLVDKKGGLYQKLWGLQAGGFIG